jgi:putative transposase
MAPDCQAFVERFIGSLRGECLRHFVFFGTRHLDSVATSYRNHYLEERPHQGKDNELLIRPKNHGMKLSHARNAGNERVSLAEIRCQERLGGLFMHYSRKAA